MFPNHPPEIVVLTLWSFLPMGLFLWIHGKSPRRWLWFPLVLVLGWIGFFVALGVEGARKNSATA
jgi:hypothetical protein